MIDAKFRLMFFDRQSVTDPAEREALKAQSKFGAFVMRAARKSIKGKEGPSSPGTPPHAHAFYLREQKPKADGTPRKPQKRYNFRDSILFGFDATRKTTIVGPQFRAGSRTRPTMPQIQEFGGTGSGDGRVIRVQNKPGRNAQGRFVSAGFTEVVLNGQLRYPKRPYMRPALERESPKFVGLFRGIIGG